MRWRIISVTASSAYDVILLLWSPVTGATSSRSYTISDDGSTLREKDYSTITWEPTKDQEDEG